MNKRRIIFIITFAFLFALLPFNIKNAKAECSHEWNYHWTNSWGEADEDAPAEGEDRFAATRLNADYHMADYICKKCSATKSVKEKHDWVVDEVEDLYPHPVNDYYHFRYARCLYCLASGKIEFRHNEEPIEIIATTDYIHTIQYICFDCGTHGDAEVPYFFTRTNNHTWKLYSTESSQLDDTNHTVTKTYKCYDCGKFKTETTSAKHGFKLQSPDKISQLNDTHHKVTKTYKCSACGKTKTTATNVKHSFKLQSPDKISQLNETYHKVTKTYKCSVCSKTKTTATNVKHTYKWQKSGKNYVYRCTNTKCKHIKKGEDEVSQSTTTNKKVKKKGTKTLTWKCTPCDSLASVKVTKGAKLVKIKSKTNNTLTYTTKKKGKATIKITMKSGAVHTFNLTIK